MNLHQEEWQIQGDNLDFKVANYAVEYARKMVASDASPQEMARFIENLPEIATSELEKQNISEKEPFRLQEAWELIGNFDSQKLPRSKTMKVFGIGADYYPQLDQLFPNSKFIFTVREKASWLKAMEAHWHNKPVFDTNPDNIEPEVTEKEDAVEITKVEGRVTFENVEFAYSNNGQVVLHEFNLEIKPGMTVALVGSSGAGKSTVAKLAMRFYDPQKGRVLLDEYDLRDVTLDSLRDHVGIVSQETLLLYGTIRDNIAYGKLDATDEEIEAAAKAANAHQFIMSFPEGYNSIIGERGLKLSGGQRQRLAIARVLVKNPQFIVLDEATSALDTESESLIQESLQKLLKDRTSIVIAHRLSTIYNADLIVVMEYGRILEMGTHAELIAKRGRYAYLHRIQFPQNTTLLESIESIEEIKEIEKIEKIGVKGLNPLKVVESKVILPELTSF